MEKIIHGDSLARLKELDENSIDSIVTDPPYGLSFMGKKWDYDVPSADLWREAMRVLKPGGHLLSFAGSRTYHRMAVNIEDAGFEMRDQIMWVYGSGFPKSHNIGKAVDKKLGKEVTTTYKPNHKNDKYGKGMGGGVTDNTPSDNEWNGWGTALKPAHEPIVMARKPFKGTVVDNVLEHGTGGINIDGCRVGAELTYKSGKPSITKENGWNDNNMTALPERTVSGRFPANFIHDGSDEVVSGFPQQKGSIGRANRKTAGKYDASSYQVGVVTETEIKDDGSAARFFYCAKASKAERNKGCEGLEEKFAPRGNNEGRDMGNPKNHLGGMQSSKMTNHHPTVKPIALMRYLVRLVTPKGGTVLDPFMGSGTTGIACKEEGFDFVGIEREEEYIEIAKARING